MASPVAGFRPIRAGRFRTWRMPRPVRRNLVALSQMAGSEHHHLAQHGLSLLLCDVMAVGQCGGEVLEGDSSLHSNLRWAADFLAVGAAFFAGGMTISYGSVTNGCQTAEVERIRSNGPERVRPPPAPPSLASSRAPIITSQSHLALHRRRKWVEFPGGALRAVLAARPMAVMLHWPPAVLRRWDTHAGFRALPAWRRPETLFPSARAVPRFLRYLVPSSFRYRLADRCDRLTSQHLTHERDRIFQ